MTTAKLEDTENKRIRRLRRIILHEGFLCCKRFHCRITGIAHDVRRRMDQRQMVCVCVSHEVRNGYTVTNIQGDVA